MSLSRVRWLSLFELTPGRSITVHRSVFPFLCQYLAGFVTMALECDLKSVLWDLWHCSFCSGSLLLFSVLYASILFGDFFFFFFFFHFCVACHWNFFSIVTVWEFHTSIKMYFAQTHSPFPAHNPFPIPPPLVLPNFLWSSKDKTKPWVQIVLPVCTWV